MTDTTAPTDPDDLAETPEQVRARLDALRLQVEQRLETASRPALHVDHGEGMGSTQRQNVLAESPKPAPTDADHRLIAGLAAMVQPGVVLEDEEVAALQVISSKALDPSDRIVVSRLLAPTKAAEQAAYDAQAPEREAAAKAGAAALKRGKYLARVKSLMEPVTEDGRVTVRSKSEAEALARAEVYGR